MRRLRPIVIGAILLALALAATVRAAETSRKEFKSAAEPICMSSTRANERILVGVRREVQRGKLKTAAAKFAAASRALKKALLKLESIPRPSADEARLAKWFSYVRVEAELFALVGRKLKAGDKADAERTTAKLYSNANKANLEVLPFGFRYCRLEPAKFT
jgi:hypothetical protein